MRKDDPSTLTNRIVSACKVKLGLALPEIQAKTGGNATVVCSITRALVKRELLHRAGSRRLFRYFAHLADATAYATTFEQERERINAAKARRKQEKLNVKRAAQRRAAGIPPRTAANEQARPQQPARPRAQVKTKAKSKPKRGPALTIGKSKAKAAAPLSIAHATTVTWPAHVKVQRAPTPLDDRYAFTPPPGWKGELSTDWDHRRKTAC